MTIPHWLSRTQQQVLPGHIGLKLGTNPRLQSSGNMTEYGSSHWVALKVDAGSTKHRLESVVSADSILTNLPKKVEFCLWLWTNSIFHEACAQPLEGRPGRRGLGASWTTGLWRKWGSTRDGMMSPIFSIDFWRGLFISWRSNVFFGTHRYRLCDTLYTCIFGGSWNGGRSNFGWFLVPLF